MEQLKKIKEHWAIVTGVIGIIIAVFMFCHNLLNQYSEIIQATKTTQQMALKSVIWNDEIPLPERASACDAYLNAGYNSLTKKECETIINKGVSDGIFSYESGVKINDYRVNIWDSTSNRYSMFRYA